jgi:hypothetical protein
MYTAHALTIASGVVSSILAILCVEAYRWARRSLIRRALANVLAIQGGSALIVASIKDKEVERKAVDYRDAYAIGHLLELCARIHIDAKMEVFHRRSEIGDECTFLSVGGPLSNDFTEEALRRFVPSFRLLEKVDIEVSQPGVLRKDGKHKDYRGFGIGDKELLASEYEEPAILVKLTPEVLKQDRTVHLIFGYSGQGTAAAAYYLSRYYSYIDGKHGKNAYCISIQVSRRDMYKSVPIEHEVHEIFGGLYSEKGKWGSKLSRLFSPRRAA